jgi:hypothetical protein
MAGLPARPGVAVPCDRFVAAGSGVNGARFVGWFHDRARGVPRNRNATRTITAMPPECGRFVRFAGCWCGNVTAMALIAAGTLLQFRECSASVITPALGVREGALIRSALFSQAPGTLTLRRGGSCCPSSVRLGIRWRAA